MASDNISKNTIRTLHVNTNGAAPSFTRSAARAGTLPKDPVYVRDSQGLQRVDRLSIRTVTAHGNYVELRAQDRRFVLRTSLCDVIQQLGERYFVQVNRNTAANLLHLLRVDTDSVLVGSEVLTLSRSYRTAVLERLSVLG